MPYAIKEIFYSLQGEGAQSGRPAVFCRSAGCNLWSGREVDRESAICAFCDTDFVGVDGVNGGKFVSASALADAIAALWPYDSPQQVDTGFVVCTGGEPLLQLDAPLIDALHERDLKIAVETNGTISVPNGLDWICVSPKRSASLVQRTGDELKLVFPQAGFSPTDLVNLEFDHFFLQPMDGPNLSRNVDAAVDYCLKHPHWKLSLQTHKSLGIP